MDAHNVDTITSLSLDFIERNQDNPFFLFVSHNTIHDPLKEKAETIHKYEQLKASGEAENHPIVAAMIERLDNSCGKIFEKIIDLGLDENTIIIFFADNGGKDQYAKQTPYRAGKGWLYEGGIRAPLIVRWPGRLASGTLVSAPVMSTDVLPTLLDLAGLPAQPSNHVDGVSLVGAQLTALVGYGRLDSFPSADPMVREWIGRNYDRPSAVEPFEAHQWAEQWGQHRGFVALHIYAEMLRDDRI